MPVGRAGAADDDVGGRHPQLLRAGVPREAGRAARALHDAVVRGRRSRDATTCSAPSTAARSTPAMIGCSRRDGAGRVPGRGWAEARRDEHARRRRASSLFQELALRHLPSSRTRPAPRAAARRGSSASRVSLAATAQTVVADEAYLRESILQPTREGRGRLPADHADVPGADQRGTAPAADRVHQVARSRTAPTRAIGDRMQSSRC